MITSEIFIRKYLNKIFKLKNGKNRLRNIGIGDSVLSI